MQTEIAMRGSRPSPGVSEPQLYSHPSATWRWASGHTCVSVLSCTASLRLGPSRMSKGWERFHLWALKHKFQKGRLHPLKFLPALSHWRKRTLAGMFFLAPPLLHSRQCEAFLILASSQRPDSLLLQVTIPQEDCSPFCKETPVATCQWPMSGAASCRVVRAGSPSQGEYSSPWDFWQAFQTLFEQEALSGHLPLKIKPINN